MLLLIRHKRVYLSLAINCVSHVLEAISRQKKNLLITKMAHRCHINPDVSWVAHPWSFTSSFNVCIQGNSNPWAVTSRVVPDIVSRIAWSELSPESLSSTYHMRLLTEWSSLRYYISYMPSTMLVAHWTRVHAHRTLRALLAFPTTYTWLHFEGVPIITSTGCIHTV